MTAGRAATAPGAAPRTLWRMARCEVCGNDYGMSFEVHAQGAVHVFDCFACAIHRMAPICEHRRVQIIGQGVEADGHWYCERALRPGRGRAGIVDKVGSPTNG